MRSPRPLATLALIVAAACPLAARAVDIIGTQNGALDQPRINAAVFPFGSTVPLTDPNSFQFDPVTFDFSFGPSYNLEAYLDTGASGIVISNSFQQNYLTPSLQPMGLQPGAAYTDVGVSSTPTPFAISTPLDIRLLPYVIGHPQVDLPGDPSHYVPIPNSAVPTGTLRATVGPIQTVVDDPTGIDAVLQGLLGDFDIIGMPAMKSRIVVMNAAPVNNFSALLDWDPFVDDTIPDVFLRTYIYDTHQTFTPANDYDPGVPTTNHHVHLTMVSFNRFTQTTGPAGTFAPTLEKNPIIGLDPNAYPVMLDKDHPAGLKGGIRITRDYSLINPITNAVTPVHGVAEGNFLLDTGAAASIISTRMAISMGVSYSADTEPNPADPEGDPLPILIDVNGNRIPDQFRLQISGIGGSSYLAGFYLDDLMLRTIEGGADDNSPDHFHFLHAPVLVGDITVKDPTKPDGDPQQFLTLDGIFGMNFLVASGLIDATDESGLPSDLGFGAFDWITIDFTDPNQGILGLNYAPADAEAVPEPASLSILAFGSLALLARRHRRS